MFGPRGTASPRPRGPGPAGTKPPGAFGPAGPPRSPAPGAPQAAPQRPPAPDKLQWTGSQRINVRVTLHRADPRKVKEKNNLHPEQKAEPRPNRWDSGPCPAGPAAPKPPAPVPVLEQSPGAQTRYTPESASSILASFGLSNEDLEELSRYPDDQLTPENMPRILREIRIRKMGHAVPGLPGPGRGEEPGAEPSGAAAKGKVIDYGHASKYGYTEDPLEVRAFPPDVLPEPPLEARVYPPEGQGADGREDLPREQSVPVAAPPASVPAVPSVPCTPVFPVEDLMKLPGFQGDSSAAPPFFPAEPPAKVSGLCPAPAALPVGPPASQAPAVLPVLPPMLPALLPSPLAQPLLPPVMPPLAQPPVSQHVLPPLPAPPFSAGLLAAISHHQHQHQHQHKQRDPGPGAPGPGPGARAAPKSFHADGPIKSPFGVVKASWLPVFPAADGQKSKRLPTPSMMNDYYATSPRIFPHLCSLCNLECTQMKDWILHQNNPSHLESCRKLRQQYPDWNPEAHSSSRNARDRKENQTPRHRSSSPSPSRWRYRPGGSGYPPPRWRSRSRSPPGRFRRPRSRSPRRPRRPSPPRHRSRSPQRSRSSLRHSPPRHSPRRRSPSAERSARRASRSQDRKAALEAVMKTLGPEFLAEFRKHKSLQAAVQGSLASGRSSSAHGPSGKGSGSAKKPLKASAAPKTSKKDGSAEPGPSSAESKAEESAQSKEGEGDEEEASTGSSKPQSASYNRLLREDLLSCGTVLQISDLPDDGFTDQDIKKLVQPFGKVSDLIVLRSRNEAYLEMNYKEAVIAAVKFGETAPVLLNGRRVRISVAERPRAAAGQAKKTVKKRVLTVKKAPTSTKKVPTSSTKTPKPLTGKKEKLKKSAVPGERKVKKTPSTGEPAEAGAAEPQGEPGGDPGQAEPSAPQGGTEGDTEPAVPLEPQPSPVPGIPSQPPQAPPAEGPEVDKALIKQEPAVTTTPSEESADPARKDPEDLCVVLISNLPDKGYSVEEVSNLAKPFGGLKDVLLLSSHKKAYLEISRKAADSMVRFYTCFPLSLDGNQLSINLVPQYKTVKDEEAIFTALIKDSDPQVDTESIHQQFVHLGNLPDDGYRELEVLCVGLRFGKVDHYVVLKNKNKAILQLDTPKSAHSMHSFLQQYPYCMGGHTLSCSLSPRGGPAQAEAGKRDVKTEEGSRASADSKKSPEGSGGVPRAAAAPPGEPRGARKGASPSSSGTGDTPAGQTEPPEPHPGAAAREPPGSLAQAALQDVDSGNAVPVDPAGTTSPADRSEEKPLPPPSAGKEEAPKAPPEPKPSVAVLEKEGRGGAEESPAPAMEPLGSSSKAEGEAGATPGVEPPGAEEAPMDVGSPAVPQPAQELGAPSKNPVPDAVKTSPEVSVAPVAERKPLPKTGEAPGKRLDEAGAEEPVTKAGHTPEENSGKLLGKAGAEAEKPLGKTVAEAGAALEDAPSAVGGSSVGSVTKSHQNKGTGAAKPDRTHPGAPLSPFLSLKEPGLGKTLLRAVVSIPDIFKPRIPGRSSAPALCPGGQQRPPPRAEPRGQPGGDKKGPPKPAAQPGAGSSQGRGNGGSAGEAQGGSRRSSSQQEKDSHVDPGTGSKQSQEGESGTSGTKEEPGGNQGPAGDKPSGTGSSGKQKEEEELFPFNLDEFVTVDEVVEEVESPVAPRRNPPRGKRKEGAKPSPSEPLPKRRKGKGSKGEPSFVTLDEIGEEEEQGLLVVDEVLEEEELSEAVKDPRALLTLDELSEQEELGPPRDAPQPELKEQDLKAEPLVTVDEIGEVEELPLNEPSELSAEEGKGNPGGAASPRAPDDPSALVTVDEIQEDNEDNPLVTLDEVNEEEDDFLADFNHLKEELNFVTVDEVGDEEEEEENTSPEENLPKDEDDEDIVAVAGPEEEEIAACAGPEEEDIVALAGPEETGILGDANPEEETPAISKPKAAQLGSGGADAESKQKKVTVPGVPKVQSTPKALDILVPKAGFFCQICSLFYADEPSMINHCRTALHRQNMEKFMAKQQDNGGEEPSSR